MSFCHRNHFSVFRNEHVQSTTLGSKLMLGWFRAILLPHVTHSENRYRGAYKAWVWPAEPFFCFSQRTCPIHYFRSKTHVWGRFSQIRCRMSPIPKIGIMVHVIEPPRLFELKCSSRTLEAATHLNLNNPLVLWISSDRATYQGSSTIISHDGET
jgi:hypothetical protein